MKTGFVFLLTFMTLINCVGQSSNLSTRSLESYNNGRLSTKYILSKNNDTIIYGDQALKIDSNRKCLVYIPKTYSKDKPSPVAFMLHGSRGKPEQAIALYRKYADDQNLIIVAPSSKVESWDLLTQESFGSDAKFIDQVLFHIFNTYTIDSTKIGIGGFSDGASYSLCLGITNGSLFTHIMAFSPGFVYMMERSGKPHVFVSHGIKDPVLPIATSSRRIVPEIKGYGLDVTYTEFIGFHEVTPEITKKAVEWFTSK